MRSLPKMCFRKWKNWCSGHFLHLKLRERQQLHAAIIPIFFPYLFLHSNIFPKPIFPYPFLHSNIFPFPLMHIIVSFSLLCMQPHACLLPNLFNIWWSRMFCHLTTPNNKTTTYFLILLFISSYFNIKV